MPHPKISIYQTIYQTFVRPHLDYVDIIYEQVYNSPFHQKIESVQIHAYQSQEQ